MASSIRPYQLPAAGAVNPASVVIIDNDVDVQKATLTQVVDAARPNASEAEAQAGTENSKSMTPLRVAQAIDALGVAATTLASTDSDKGAGLSGFDQASTYGAGTVGKELQGTTNVGIGQMFAQNGVKAYRLGDRILVGGANGSDITFPNVTKDWLSQFQTDAGLSSGSLLSAVAASLTNTAPSSASGGVFGAQSLHFTGANPSCIGITGIAVNNNATLATRAWGGYFEAHKIGPFTTGSRGVEIDVRVVSGSPEIDPFPNQQTFTSALQLGAGCELDATGQQNVGAVAQIVPNPMQFRKGFVFHRSSLEGTDGTSGRAVAMAYASFMSQDWYNNSNARVAAVWCNSTVPSGELRFTANGPLLLGPNFKSVALFADAPDAVNNFIFSGSIAGSPVALSATGADTNVDLRFNPKGAGLLRFGTLTAVGAETITGYITIKDAAGAPRKLAVIS